MRSLYERHYSCHQYRNGRKPKKFIGPAEYICLTLPRRQALFVWLRPKQEYVKDGQIGVRCGIFRNESKILSSDLIREADAIADFCWPGQRHYTYVRAEAVQSRNPGWCFLCAGWNRCGYTKVNRLLILEKPPVLSAVEGSGAPLGEPK